MLNTSYSKKETQKMVEACPHWYHQMDVGHGIITPGGNDPKKKLNRIGFPEALEGLTVLDVGANDGFFSFEAERRGAERVLATDFPHWTGTTEHGQWTPRKVHFDTAKKLLGSEIEEKTISIYDISPETVGMFDIVLCLGVIYHLLHPTVGIQNIVKVAKKLVILESALIPDNRDGKPSMHFTLEGYAGDPGNWWYPSQSCTKQMLLAFGCEETRLIGGPGWNAHRFTVHGRVGEEGVPPCWISEETQ